jgi:fructoselysine-6-P-deglycase FrlB-like protein
MGSAHEGALLFHETARTSAVPMSCAQFRHGPVEAVSRDLRAFVFASQKETYELDVALADDLRGLGASVRTVQTPALADAWAAVVEIVPLQIAAVRLAGARGIPPAQFQFAPMVTVDERGFANPARE